MAALEAKARLGGHLSDPNKGELSGRVILEWACAPTLPRSATNLTDERYQACGSFPEP